MGEYKGLERRGAPREGEITDEQARDALERAITEAKFTEGDTMKERIRGLILPVVKPTVTEQPTHAETENPAETTPTGSLKDLNLFRRTALDPQARKYVETLVGHEEQGYDLAHNTLTDGGLYDPEEEGIIKAPTTDESIAILQRDLSMEEVEAIRKRAERAKGAVGFVMVPKDLPWRRFIQNLDTGTRNRYDTSVSASRVREFNRQDAALGIQPNGEITSWQVGIAETEKEPANQSGLLGDIIQRWLESDEAKILQLVDHKLDAFLQKRALLSGDRKPLDTTGWAILQRADKPQKDESPIICPDGGLVSDGHSVWLSWGDPRVSFSGSRPDGVYGDARLRFAVMKNA